MIHLGYQTCVQMRLVAPEVSHDGSDVLGGAMLFTVYAKPTSNPIEYPLSKIFHRTVET